MRLQPSLDHAEAYLNIQLSRSGHGHLSKPVGPFVTVSREAGAGGSTYAHLLAARLDEEIAGETPWTVFDRNLVETMLQSEHLSPQLARFLPEDKVSEIDASIGELLGLHPNLWNLMQRTNELMRGLARVGHVILVGRGANYATEHVANGLHVRLVASPAYRCNQIGRELNVPPEEAVNVLVRTDAARRSYVRSVFQTEIARPDGYDVVFNVGTLPLEQLVEVTAALLCSRLGAMVR